jgi:hypothetical protein
MRERMMQVLMEVAKEDLDGGGDGGGDGGDHLLRRRQVGTALEADREGLERLKVLGLAGLQIPV